MQINGCTKGDQIGPRIKKLRISQGLTQVEFAEAIGVDGSHISKIERGLANPSYQLLKLICHEFSVSEPYLLDSRVGSATISGGGSLKAAGLRCESRIESVTLSVDKSPMATGLRPIRPNLLKELERLRKNIRIMVENVTGLQASIETATGPTKSVLKEKDRLKKALADLEWELGAFFHELDKAWERCSNVNAPSKQQNTEKIEAP